MRAVSTMQTDDGTGIPPSRVREVTMDAEKSPDPTGTGGSYLVIEATGAAGAWVPDVVLKGDIGAGVGVKGRPDGGVELRACEGNVGEGGQFIGGTTAGRWKTVTELVADREPIVAIGAQAAAHAGDSRIENGPDLIEAMRDGINGWLPGVVGMDDEATRGDGARLFTLLLSSEHDRIPVVIGGKPEKVDQVIERLGLFLDAQHGDVTRARATFAELRELLEVPHV